MPQNAIFQIVKGNIHNCSSNKSWNFQRFYRQAKIFINKYFVEGELPSWRSEGHFFFLSFLEIYCNKDEAIFQWWRTMEKKKLLQKENLYQVLGNECFDKFFIEHQLFRKQHCATTHVSCSVCVAKKLVTCRTVILHCFSSSQKIQTKCERKDGIFFFFWNLKKNLFLKKIRYNRCKVT